MDENPLTRFGLSSLANLHPRLCVGAEADSAREACRICESQLPELIIIDPDLPGGGPTLLRDLIALHSAARVLVVSACETPLLIRRAYRAGAYGYATKGENPAELMPALEAAISGRNFQSARVTALLLAEVRARETEGWAGHVSDLSDRELAVFVAMGRRAGGTEIAGALGVSIKTIETHQRRIKLKLKLKNAGALHRAAEKWVRRNSKRRKEV